MDTPDDILRMCGIRKRFGPVLALDSVDFSVARGEIHALLGVNGAGKSTLIRILSGLYTADAGSIEIAGERRTIASPSDAIKCGVASVQQHPELVEDFTGYENIFLGQEAAGRTGRGLFGRIDRKAMRRKAGRLLERLPLDIDLDRKVGTLSGVEREIVAVLHAMRQENVRILILDEPTSTLTRVEKVQLFGMMGLLRDSGVSIVYITHRLEEVFEIADRFTVFRGGRKIATLSSGQAREGDVSIPQLMLQDEMGELFPSKAGTRSDAPAALATRALALRGVFENISLEARPGEVLGIFGLVGSGIDELAKTLFGVMRPSSGDLFLKGERVAFGSPRDALRGGIFLVPGDRRREGLVLADDVVFNATLADQGRASIAGVRRFAGNARDVAGLAERVALTPPDVRRPASVYSGGNQQKIVIAKGLYSRSDVYVFVEPTVGVDVGARATLYALIRTLSETATVILMSSDCDEVFGLADRMGAMYRGRLVAEPSVDITRDELLEHGLMGAAR